MRLASMRTIWGVVAFLVVAYGLSIFSAVFFSDPISPTAQTVAERKIVDSPEFQKLQRKREAFMQKLGERGLVSKIDFRGWACDVWVGSAFYLLPFDAKKDFVEVVWAYHFDGRNTSGVVHLRDNMSGKEVGTYRLGEFTMN